MRIAMDSVILSVTACFLLSAIGFTHPRVLCVGFKADVYHFWGWTHNVTMIKLLNPNGFLFWCRIAGSTCKLTPTRPTWTSYVGRVLLCTCWVQNLCALRTGMRWEIGVINEKLVKGYPKVFWFKLVPPNTNKDFWKIWVPWIYYCQMTSYVKQRSYANWHDTGNGMVIAVKNWVWMSRSL